MENELRAGSCIDFCCCIKAPCQCLISFEHVAVCFFRPSKYVSCFPQFPLVSMGSSILELVRFAWRPKKLWRLLKLSGFAPATRRLRQTHQCRMVWKSKIDTAMSIGSCVEQKGSDTWEIDGWATKCIKIQRFFMTAGIQVRRTHGTLGPSA